MLKEKSDSNHGLITKRKDDILIVMLDVEKSPWSNEGKKERKAWRVPGKVCLPSDPGPYILHSGQHEKDSRSLRAMG